MFASDALSSNAYATQEILLMLSVGGVALYSFTPWVALGVILVFFVVVASYRQNVRAYPSGGGDYEVVSTNLGERAGVFVASALMVDYVMTVAVSIRRQSRISRRLFRQSASRPSSLPWVSS